VDTVNRVLPYAPTESAATDPDPNVRKDVAVLRVEMDPEEDPPNDTAVPFDVMPTLDKASGEKTPIDPSVVNDFR
jgi:hypothetical protein